MRSWIQKRIAEVIQRTKIGRIERQRTPTSVFLLSSYRVEPEGEPKYR